MELKGKNVLIIGMARSGISAAKLCHKLGAQVRIYDGKEQSNFEDKLDSLKKYPFKYIFGSFDDCLLSSADMLVLSPGVPTDLPFIEKARIMGILVIGEVELASNFCKGPIIAITGTNGKTSTTSLVGEIIKANGDDTYVVGNIGRPFSEVVLDIKTSSSVVAEISSFQLETIINFKPRISAILNLTEDHLNRHKTFENYINTKLRITENQSKDDYCILNYDDPLCRNLEESIPSNIIWFSMKNEVEGVYYSNDQIIANINHNKEIIVGIEEVKLLGSHNIENIMAAVAMAICANVSTNVIRKAVKAFKGVEHRIEYVDTVGDVKFYNDSKATNPDAAIKGIKAMITPTILIGGGMDKGSTFNEWFEAFDDKVRALIVFGETTNIIKRTAEEYNFENTIIVKNLEEAVSKAYELAKKGDSVLLSPACASWDMFESYEERGNLFKELVKEL